MNNNKTKNDLSIKLDSNHEVLDTENTIKNNKREIDEEENDVMQILSSNRDVTDNFLDYDRRASEGKFLLNQYFDNPKLTTLCGYLWFNFTATCTYLNRYRIISNLLYEHKSNKTILVVKHVIYITYAFVKMLLISCILLTIRLAISVSKLIFYICEFLLSLLTCILFSEEIESILKRFNKKFKENSNKNDSKINRYWKNLKEYWKYIFAKMTGKINTSRKIKRPQLNLILLKSKKISFAKKLLMRIRHWTKLKMFNMRLINIIDNNKNKVRKKNAKNQFKYIKKVLENYRKNKNIKKSKTKKQTKRKTQKRAKNKLINKIKAAKSIYDIKDKLIKKVVEFTAKAKKLEFLGEQILFKSLFLKVTKSFVNKNDLESNLTKSQQTKYDRHNKAEEEKKNNKDKENNQKDKTNSKTNILNKNINEKNNKTSHLDNIKNEDMKNITKIINDKENDNADKIEAKKIHDISSKLLNFEDKKYKNIDFITEENEMLLEDILSEYDETHDENEVDTIKSFENIDTSSVGTISHANHFDKQKSVQKECKQRI